jgi:hypothetical protein
LAGALIVLAELGKADFAWLDALRRRHYPPERNRVPAHLTLFRSLPPSAQGEVKARLSRTASAVRPTAELAGVMDLDGGVALRVFSPGLDELREQLADQFHGLLSAQDRGPWTAHVTIQNKVEQKEARSLVRELRAGFEPRPLEVKGLGLVRYADGEWNPVSSWRFR